MIGFFWGSWFMTSSISRLRPELRSERRGDKKICCVVLRRYIRIGRHRLLRVAGPMSSTHHTCRHCCYSWKKKLDHQIVSVLVSCFAFWAARTYCTTLYKYQSPYSDLTHFWSVEVLRCCSRNDVRRLRYEISVTR